MYKIIFFVTGYLQSKSILQCKKYLYIYPLTHKSKAKFHREMK